MHIFHTILLILFVASIGLMAFCWWREEHANASGIRVDDYGDYVGFFIGLALLAVDLVGWLIYWAILHFHPASIAVLAGIVSLHDFKLDDLAEFTSEKSFPANASKDFRLFFAGRDDVHRVLRHVLSRVTTSLYLNMFGYDDDELNDIVMGIVHNPQITCLITLDKSQAGGVHEKRLLDSDAAKDPDGFRTHFVIGQSATHQISHTKGFVADGVVGCEGSTNWSSSGEGTFILKATSAGGTGYKAQNNTQTVFTDPHAVQRFQAELIAEHLAAQRSKVMSHGS